MVTFLMIIQVLIAIGLIALTALTTTKSETSGGGGFGWGTLGGKASSAVAGLEDQLGRLTTILAVVFLVISAAVAWVSHLQG